MPPRIAPSRAFRTRDAHRKWLTLHFVVLALGLCVAFAANRFLSPDRFWAHWVALVAGVVFLGHLGLFARSTMATMGGRRR